MPKGMSSPTILIIEDQKVLLDALVEKLTHAGYNVLTAEDGKSGLELFTNAVPDLVLLDIILPKMSGIEILKQVKQDPKVAQIPIIVISNSGQPVEIEELLRIGVKDYLIKAEFEPEEVLEKMEKVLGPRPIPSRNKSENPVRPQTSEKETPPSKGAEILVVEDDKFLRDLLASKLRNAGYGVEEAIDGTEAMQKLEKGLRPRIIMLDLVLPGIDGFEVLQRIKKNSAYASIPVIVLSNLGQQEDVARAKSLGAVEYLIKAYFTPGEILEKIEKILRESYF